ncbi:MAG: NAD-dependent epimerase/dehydratase family protein, partial [Opitutales bacterium]|nr:NAD-dependent epimerase/dehydratase family protein [Opitutales bacterium]
MKIILSGGSGQVGRLLSRAFVREGHECVILTRGTGRSLETEPYPGETGRVRFVAWDGHTRGPWCAEVDGADVVINLAGRSVDCRYTEANLRDMLRSRTESTRVIGEAIANANKPPQLWLQASTATIYAHRFDAANDEITGIIGGSEPGVPKHWKRSVEIGQAWEAALFEAPTPATRRVAMRSAMVMSPDAGGIFDAFATLCRFGMGHLGDGKAYVSWIHEHDFVAAVRFLMDESAVDGVVNLASPNPLPNKAFIGAVHAALGRRWSVQAPAWLLEIGAFFRRTETELLLTQLPALFWREPQFSAVLP